MAFGKDDSHLASLPTSGRSFGQQSAAASARPTRSSSKIPYWLDTFQLGENVMAPDTIRLIPGAYEQEFLDNPGESIVRCINPFVKIREHRHGATKRGAICSAGPFFRNKNKAQLCYGCIMYWEDWKEREAKKSRGDKSRGPNRMSMYDRYIFNVWDYGCYFDMPQVDGNGQFRMNPKTNQPYTRWEKAINVNDPKYQGRAWKMGHLSPWSISQTYQDTLVGYSEVVGATCGSCGGSIISKGWFCGNPNCGQFIFDQMTTTLSPEQQAKIRHQDYTCPHCGQLGPTREEIQCTSCQQPRRTSIFDVDLVGYRQVSGDNNKANLIIMSFSPPRPIQVQDPEVLKTIKPMDLLKRFAPTSPADQARIWNLTEVPGQQQAQPPQQQPWQSPPAAMGQPIPYQQPIPATGYPQYAQQAPMPPQPVPQPASQQQNGFAQLAGLLRR